MVLCKYSKVLAKTCTKFALNLLEYCRDIVSDPFCKLIVKFDNGLFNQLGFYHFCQHSQFHENLVKKNSGHLKMV